MVRTTIRLDQDIKLEAQQRALTDKKTLQTLVNEALRSYLGNTSKENKKLTLREIIKPRSLGVQKQTLTRKNVYKKDEIIG